MKILAGAAQGLKHLHVNCNPPVINRDVKCANILLGEEYHPKLADFGLAKLGPTGDDTHVSTRVMGTPGYCAPEYLESGQLTIKSDVYSFGVVILEVITGRKALDQSRIRAERSLAEWVSITSCVFFSFIELLLASPQCYNVCTKENIVLPGISLVSSDFYLLLKTGRNIISLSVVFNHLISIICYLLLLHLVLPLLR